MGAIQYGAVLVVMILAGCSVKKFPYEYLDFTNDLQATEVGAPSTLATFDVSQFPILYKLKEAEYTLYVGIDTESHSPTAAFWATNSNGENIHVSGQPIPCRAAFFPIDDHDPLKKRFSYAETKFVWRPTVDGSCSSLTDEELESLSLTLDLNDGYRDIARREVSFKVVRNGSFAVVDAI